MKNNLAKYRKKALARRKALALVRRIQKLNLVRNWNVHASDEGDYVSVTDCYSNLNTLKKAMKLRNKIRFGYRNDDERWGTIILKTK